MGSAAPKKHSNVFDYVSRQAVDDLWSAGFTIIQRNRSGDPFGVDPKIVPSGMVYEWRAKSVMGHMATENIADMATDGWQFVPSARHDGVFMSAGYDDVIEIGGQVLMERPKAYADKVNQARVDLANKNVEDWMARNGAAGFFGGVRSWTGNPNRPTTEFKIVGDAPMAQKVIDSADGQISVQAPVVVKLLERVPRHRALRWLFNLISVEKTS